MKPFLFARASSQLHSGVVPFSTAPLLTKNKTPVLRITTKAPLLLRLAKTMIRWRIRGGDRLVGIVERLGLLNVIVQYPLGRGVNFSVPLFRADTCWDRHDVDQYERRLVHSFCRLLEPLSDVVLFDCGADIGTFSALVCSQTSRVTRVMAFEPNPDVAQFMKRNLLQLLIPSEAITKAVGCCKSTGRLEVPDYDNSDHARYLVLGDGALEVVTIDSCAVRGGDIAIKVDVEGGELEALRGAAETITSARNCVIAVEANPRVARRTKRDPVECLRFLQSLRHFKFEIAETAESPLISSALITEGQKRNLNVIAWT
ncbi:MAG TPA: FkbM family methyltransferase [Terriglobales bacterium]|nr:FkbM family methyltransferase [Terriglobales bacterium]